MKKAVNTEENKSVSVSDKALVGSVSIVCRTERSDTVTVDTSKPMPGIQSKASGKASPFESTNKECVAVVGSAGDGDVGGHCGHTNDSNDERLSTIVSEMSSLELSDKQKQTNGSKQINDTQSNGNQQTDNRRNYNYKRNQFTNASHGYNLYNNRKHNNNGNNGQNGNNYKVYTNRTYYRNETNRSNEQNRNYRANRSPNHYMSTVPVMPQTDYYNSHSRAMHYMGCNPYELNPYVQPIAYFVPHPIAGQSQMGHAIPLATHQQHTISAGSGDHSQPSPTGTIDDESTQRPDSRNDSLKACNEMANVNVASFVPFHSSVLTPYPPKYFGVINMFFGENGAQYYYFISIDPPNITPYLLSVDINGLPILPSNCFIAQ